MAPLSTITNQPPAVPDLADETARLKRRNVALEDQLTAITEKKKCKTMYVFIFSDLAHFHPVKHRRDDAARGRCIKHIVSLFEPVSALVMERDRRLDVDTQYRRALAAQALVSLSPGIVQPKIHVEAHTPE